MLAGLREKIVDTRWRVTRMKLCKGCCRRNVWLCRQFILVRTFWERRAGGQGVRTPYSKDLTHNTWVD